MLRHPRDVTEPHPVASMRARNDSRDQAIGPKLRQDQIGERLFIQARPLRRHSFPEGSRSRHVIRGAGGLNACHGIARTLRPRRPLEEISPVDERRSPVAEGRLDLGGMDHFPCGEFDILIESRRQFVCSCKQKQHVLRVYFRLCKSRILSLRPRNLMMIDSDQILEFFSDNIGIDTSDIESDTLLFSSGVIDSFALVSLMLFLETEGGFRMSPTDVNLDNLDSVDRIVSFCQRMADQ